MKIYGRIACITVTVLSALRWMYYYYLETGKFNWDEVTHNIPVVLIAWYLGKKYDEAKFLSDFDALTNTKNRRYIFRQFPKTAKRAAKKQSPLTLFLIDINWFKQINDNHGHNVGDDVLKRIAGILKETRQKTDIVCRWGGDEFIVVAPRMNEQEALLQMEQWKKSIDNLTPFIGAPVSASIGMSSFPQEGENLEQLVKNADHQMYLDKNYMDMNIDEPLCEREYSFS
jgi:diguanylate cyclase (GGDEF)-like protein